MASSSGIWGLQPERLRQQSRQVLSRWVLVFCSAVCQRQPATTVTRAENARENEHKNTMNSGVFWRCVETFQHFLCFFFLLFSTESKNVGSSRDQAARRAPCGLSARQARHVHDRANRSHALDWKTEENKLKNWGRRN